MKVGLQVKIKTYGAECRKPMRERKEVLSSQSGHNGDIHRFRAKDENVK